MRQFNGFDEAKESARSAGGAKLPAGAYVCKILGVKYINGENGNSDSIAIQFDIAEGDYKDFFKNQYDANTSEDKKFKGKTTIYCPKDDGTQEDGWTKKSFAGWTNAFEDSNAGYSWDWQEIKWIGLNVGIVFGETGNVINGKEVVYTEARFAVSVSDVREGRAAEAKFKSKNGYGKNTPSSNGSGTGFMSIPNGIGEELPFN